MNRLDNMTHETFVIDIMLCWTSMNISYDPLAWFLRSSFGDWLKMRHDQLSLKIPCPFAAGVRLRLKICVHRHHYHDVSHLLLKLMILNHLQRSNIDWVTVHEIIANQIDLNDDSNFVSRISKGIIISLRCTVFSILPDEQ